MAAALNASDDAETRIGQTIELFASRHGAATDRDAYARMTTDAMAGSRTLFVREDDAEEASRIVDPERTADTPVCPYEHGTWRPPEAGCVAPPEDGTTRTCPIMPSAHRKDGQSANYLHMPTSPDAGSANIT